MLLRLAPLIAIAVLVGPLLFGTIATLFPAFGYFPALGSAQFSLDPFGQLFSEPGIFRSALLCLASGLVTTAVSLVIVAGFFAAWGGSRFFSWLTKIISPLLAVPHAAIAFGIAFIIAPSGWFVRLISPELTGWARPPDLLIVNDPYGLTMMIGLIFKEIPFLFLVGLGALPQLRHRQFSALAAGFGYGRMTGFILGVWPGLYAQLRLAVFAVIAYASSVVDVALILGPTNPAPLAVRLVSWMNDPDLAMRFKASAGALLQLGVTAIAIFTWLLIERLSASLSRLAIVSGWRGIKDDFLRWLNAAMIIFAIAAMLGGLFVLIIWSLAGYWGFPDALPENFTLRNWQRQTGALTDSFLTTLWLGLAAALIGLIIVLANLEHAERRGRQISAKTTALIYLPLLVPQPVFIFGLQIFFLLMDWNGSFWALVLVHLIFVLPYVFLSLSENWQAFDQRYIMSALSIGIGPDRSFWYIRFPMLLRAILIALAIGFAVSVGQYLPTILIGAGRWPTLTTEAVALASGGDRRIIGVYAFAQMALPFIGFILAAFIPALAFRNRRLMRTN